MNRHEPADVFSPREIAAAAGVSEADVRARLARGQIRSILAFLPAGVPADPRLDELIPRSEALRTVRALVAGEPMPPDGGGAPRLLPVRDGQQRDRAVPFVMATSAHGLLMAVVLIVGSLGFAAADEKTETLDRPEPIRLVFLATPGPGGGGGGGGLETPRPAVRAERKGSARTPSPIVARRVPPPPPVRPAPKRPVAPPMRPSPRPPERPPAALEAGSLPVVAAPVATVAADTRDREGTIEAAPVALPPDSRGPGSGGGAGTGAGTGVGQGQGAGIGPGEGGGTGGGPYRPGSGVEPPRLLREVRADYTDHARRAGLTGEVVLEIVVLSTGGVGDVRVLRRLGGGLDERAVAAVRGWRFAPATLRGTPVDVLVEVAVEFRLR
jgi:TonB family protein